MTAPEKRGFTITLDEPERWMNENEMRKHHWSKRNYLTSYWRQIANARARTAWRRQPPLGRSLIIVQFFWPDARVRDPANWYPTAKAVVDGLVDAKVFVDDSSEYVVGPDMRGGRGPRRIEITVQEL